MKRAKETTIYYFSIIFYFESNLLYLKLVLKNCLNKIKPKLEQKVYNIAFRINYDIPNSYKKKNSFDYYSKTIEVE